MGLNLDLVNLLGLPSSVPCPSCGEKVPLWFDDYDVEGSNQETGVFEIREMECYECGAGFRVRSELSVKTTVTGRQPRVRAPARRDRPA